MNARLHSLIADAEARLGPKDRDKLAALLETFLATHDDGEPFTQDERAHIAELAAEPFDPADPAEVAAFFARRGLGLPIQRLGPGDPPGPRPSGASRVRG